MKGAPSLLGVDAWFHTSDVEQLQLQHAPYGFRDTINSSVLREWQGAISDSTSMKQHELLTMRATCAVVGSSGALLNSSLGRKIDTADHVIRMNTAPTAHFARDVGSKTTIRVATLNAGLHAQKDGLLADGRTQLVYYCHVFWIGACWGWIPREPIPRLSPSLLRVAQAVMRTSRLFPSSGAMSILLGFALCKKVSIYGFGMTADTRCSKYYGPCTEPSLYYAHLSRKQIFSAGKKAGHFVESGGTYHDLESERTWLQSMGYTPPVKDDARIAGWEGVSLNIEPWVDPNMVARLARQQQQRVPRKRKANEHGTSTSAAGGAVSDRRRVKPQPMVNGRAKSRSIGLRSAT